MADYTGTTGNDTLTGSSGPDRLIGLAGDDLYYVDHADDIIVEAASEGFDRVLAGLSYVLSAGAHVEMLTTTDNAALSSINLTGNELSQYIYGNAGSNRLDGGGGGDVMVGFEGDDFYVVRHVTDRALEFAGGGFDRVLAEASFTLEAGSEVEMFTTTDNLATTAINLTGNALSQYLYGNAGSNILDGGGGGDVMVGFEGDDFYYTHDASDRALEFTGGGFDRVLAGASFTLEAGSEVEMFTTIDNLATTAINLTGNALGQYLYGNAGSNILDGGGGGDVMVGFEGDDIYYTRNAADRALEFTGGGFDRVLAGASFTLEAGSEVEMFTTIDNIATTAIDLTGNAIDQYLYGNAGANILDGKGGIDVLTGFGGADSFAFTTALGAGNVDRVIDFNAADDTVLLGGAGSEPFAQLASGALAAASFVIGAGALDANDYLIYNSGTGALLYDADGNGGGAAVQFATLSTGLTLTAADFFVSGPANNAPAISSGATASVAENSPTSTIVYQTQASDADGDRFTYSLSGADANLLTIDASGAVRLLNSPDFETRTTYNFNVLVSDSGTSTSKAVTLTVIDQQDVATPIINETALSNDTSGNAQFIDRTQLAVASNPNLPNDDLPSATIQGDVSHTNDRDFFSITLQQGELLVLDVDGTGGGLDSLLKVFGPNGTTLIGDNDDQGSFDPGSVPTIAPHNTDSYFQFRAPAAGTYYFSIESFQGGSSGTYKINVSIGPPATAEQIKAETFEADAQALISGSEWNHTNLTFGFPQFASQYPSSFPEADPASDFQPFSAVQQAATRLLVQLIANVSSLTFTELTGGSSPSSGAGSADLRYAMSTDDSVEAAHAYFPTNGGPTSRGGSSWFNTTSFNNPLKGNYAWMGILHETGHALGLKHGHESPAVSSGNDSVENTVMTYRAYVGDGIAGGYGIETFGYPQTLMMLDIAALQEVYGANFAFNATDSVYSWNSSTGEMSINGVGQGAPGNGAGGEQNRVFLTIWDGGGSDTYNMSNYSNGVTIDLRPGEWSITSAEQLANLRAVGGPTFARGNIANALQHDGDDRSLIENAVGGSGNDRLVANEAANHLTGGAGADTFAWAYASSAGPGASADTIIDLLRGTDRIDLSGADAKVATLEDDGFSFIGTDAFHNVAGELRYQAEGVHLRIQGDTDGNGLSDFEIIVNNNTFLTTTDFIL
jgi:Ca2+-binding RTX toxin-like protein